MTITCAQAQSTLLSTVADAGLRMEAQHHVLSCANCSQAETEPNDHVFSIERFFRGRKLVRTALAVVGLIQLTLALPWLVGSHSWWDVRSGTADLHLARDGMIAMVISSAAFIGAASRRFAWFCVVPTALTVMVQVATAFLDERNNNVTLGFELIHLLGLVIVVLLLLEVRPTKASGAASGR